MAWLGRANDIIRHRIKSLPHGGELRRRAICQKLRRGGFARCGLLHLLAMLVHARDEQRVIAIEALEARDCIGRDPLIGMADMRRPIGIGNGGGDVERPATGHGSQTLPASWHFPSPFGRRCPAGRMRGCNLSKLTTIEPPHPALPAPPSPLGEGWSSGWISAKSRSPLLRI